MHVRYVMIYDCVSGTVKHHVVWYIHKYKWVLYYFLLLQDLVFTTISLVLIVTVALVELHVSQQSVSSLGVVDLGRMSKLAANTLLSTSPL